MLITTIAQLRSASSINLSNTIDTWLPYISDAEEMFIIPVIGLPLYDSLVLYMNPENGSGTTNDIKDGLIMKIQKALALYALFLGVDEMSISISSAGIQVLQSDSHKPASQYQIMNLKETYLSRAHRQIDLILSYIATNHSSLPNVVLPVSPYFIRSADEFQLNADIHGSRRVFLSLMPIIGSIEKKFIKPTLSPLLFDDLKTKFQNESLSTDEKVLVDLITPALAHLTMARALMEINIDILDWGIFNNAANTFNNLSTKALANAARISTMYDANLLDGESELKMLQELLDNTASAVKYPLYFTSSRYVGPELSVKRNEFINEATKSIFVS